MRSVSCAYTLRRMRLRLIVLPLVLVLLVLAGCGSSGPTASSVRQAELSYFPSSSPFVLSVATDPNSPAIKHAQALENRFPEASLGQAALSSRLQQVGINYDSDIRPLFGYPATVGATGTTLNSTSGRQFLVVWTTKDSGKLNALLKKLGAHASGSHDGATLYVAGNTALAVSGATLMLGPNFTTITAALDRHQHGGGISSPIRPGHDRACHRTAWWRWRATSPEFSPRRGRPRPAECRGWPRCAVTV